MLLVRKDYNQTFNFDMVGNMYFVMCIWTATKVVYIFLKYFTPLFSYTRYIMAEFLICNITDNPSLYFIFGLFSNDGCALSFSV